MKQLNVPIACILYIACLLGVDRLRAIAGESFPAISPGVQHEDNVSFAQDSMSSGHGSTGSQLGLKERAGGDIRPPQRPSTRHGLQALRLQSIDSTDVHLVRIAYIIPSNRTPQSAGVANLQSAILQAQSWFQDQMERHGFGRRTFPCETEPDGVTPKVYVVDVAETDDYLRGQLWDRTIQAASAAGVPVWTAKQIWWLIPETHLQGPDGSVTGGTALGAGFGSGDDAGVAMLGSDSLARLDPNLLNNDTPYHGQTLPGIGPFPLVQSVSFPWFEGTTLSSIASSVLGAAIHELSHAFGLPHNFRNDQNFNGNLMGNGLRGVRGNFYPDTYPQDYTRIGYGEALALAVHRLFNPEMTYADNAGPIVSFDTTGPTHPVDGLLPIRFTASDSSGLSVAWLHRGGDLIDEMALSGLAVSETFTTPYYTPGQDSHYTITVFDIHGNKVSASGSIFPNAGLNQAPQPYVIVSSPTSALNQNVLFDASLSLNPDGNDALQFEWDLDGNGQFDTLPNSNPILTHAFTTPGDRLVRARVSDSLGAKSLSVPIAVRVLASVIAGRHIFYNDSAFDDGDPLATEADDDAIASSKTALLPGQAATVDNYTSYSQGINGVMIDIAGLPGTPAPEDFSFKIGNSGFPSVWEAGPAPSSIAVRPGAGNDNSDRITLIWANHMIQNEWLQITIKATENTGLASDEVFYFGNATGECTGNGSVNVQDVGLTRQVAGQNATIASLFDHDRSGVVNVVDVARARATAGFTLHLFQAP